VTSTDDEDFVAYVTPRLSLFRRVATQLVGDPHRILVRTFLEERRPRWAGVRLGHQPASEGRAEDPSAAPADRMLLRDALATLPPKQRAVLVLRRPRRSGPTTEASASERASGGGKNGAPRALEPRAAEQAPE